MGAGKKILGRKRHLLVDTDGFDPQSAPPRRQHPGSRRRRARLDQLDERAAQHRAHLGRRRLRRRHTPQMDGEQRFGERVPRLEKSPA